MSYAKIQALPASRRSWVWRVFPFLQWIGSVDKDTFRADLIAAITGMTKDDYLDAVRSVFTEDVRTQLQGIDKPMHIVTGDQDQRTPLAAAESVHALVTGSTLEIIPNAAHLSNIDNPVGFLAAVGPFLDRVRG